MDFKDLYEGPRYEKRAKTRKVNKLLNIGIVLVLVGIVFVSYKLFFGGSEQASSEVSSNKPIMSAKDLKPTDEKKEDEKEAVEEETDTTEENATEEEKEKSEEETVTEETEMTVENSDDPNVKETIVNQAWKPVGTTQSEPHVATYDSTSTDWQEMLKTMEYATGLTQQDWTLWRIRNGGSPNHALGVVSTKDKKYVYRVHMEWVKNEGWKPSKLETLNEVPPEYTGTSLNTTDGTESSDE